MANQRDDDNSGTLFNNDRKQKDSHPDKTGKVKIEGVEYYISGWIKESKRDGSKFLSLAFKRVDDARRASGGDRDRGGRDDRRDYDRRDDRRDDRDDRRGHDRPPARRYDDVPF